MDVCCLNRLFDDQSQDKIRLRKAGINALTKELGLLGMALFLRQYDSGYGDYIAERDSLLKDITLDEVEQELSTKIV